MGSHCWALEEALRYEGVKEFKIGQGRFGIPMGMSLFPPDCDTYRMESSFTSYYYKKSIAP